LCHVRGSNHDACALEASCRLAMAKKPDVWRESIYLAGYMLTERADMVPDDCMRYLLPMPYNISLSLRSNAGLVSGCMLCARRWPPSAIVSANYQ
jgi:hypothetical protein